jgi:Fe-S cluster biogenesis protein NfuA
MSGSRDDREFRKRMERIEFLLQEVDRFEDPTARAQTREIVQALLDLHGAGLEKTLEKIAEAGETGLATIDSLAQDDLVGNLLLLYGLHPLDIETRVRQALDKIRPYLRSHGATVEFLGVARGVVRLRMQGSCSSSAATLKVSIEEAIYDKAPDVTAIEVEGETVGEVPVVTGLARVALPILHG